MIAPVEAPRRPEEEVTFMQIAMEIRDLLQDATESLRVIASRQPKESKQCQAIRLLVDIGPDNLSAIAKAIGVHRTTLYRWPSFAEALEKTRAAAQWSRRDPRAVRHHNDGALIGEDAE